MKRLLALTLVSLGACLHHSASSPPVDMGDGRLMYESMGHSVDRGLEKLVRRAYRFCARQNAQAAIEGEGMQREGGHRTEERLVFRCIAGKPPLKPEGLEDADELVP